MVLPSVRRWHEGGALASATWLSLQPKGPRHVRFTDLPLDLWHLSLSPSDLRSYARTKEKLWRSIHGLGGPGFRPEDFRFFSRYNWFTTDSLLQYTPDMDVAYVHDFQLLQVGALLGPAAPACLQWHVPFVPSLIEPYTRRFVVKALEQFDAVIVSTRRDLEGLAKAGFHGTVRQVYPHFEPADWTVPDGAGDEAACEALGIRPDDQIVLVVARMDPMKRQDLAIRATARLRRRFPRLRLVLVGNGSFSSDPQGGLGLDKSRRWARRLHSLARRLRLGQRVVFAHWIPDLALSALYRRADAVLLPSDVEGFGLTIFEAWFHRSVPIVSRGAGASEIVDDGHDGYTFPPGDVAALADCLGHVLSASEHRHALGATGNSILRRYDVSRAAPRIEAILRDIIDEFGGG